MNGNLSLTVRRFWHNLAELLEMIKIGHSVLALPFAFMGAVLAARGLPDGRTLFFILVAMVGARSARDKRGADRGIDGVMNLRDEYSGEYKKIILQVKGGQVSVSQVRDLKGVLEREKAEIGVFLTLRKPTRQMQKEADEAEPFIDQGFPEKRFPRLQILTIEEIFAGKKINFPTWWSQDTFKRAARRRKNNPEEAQNNLLKELQEPYLS